MAPWSGVARGEGFLQLGKLTKVDYLKSCFSSCFSLGICSVTASFEGCPWQEKITAILESGVKVEGRAAWPRSLISVSLSFNTTHFPSHNTQQSLHPGAAPTEDTELPLPGGQCLPFNRNLIYVEWNNSWKKKSKQEKSPGQRKEIKNIS